MTKHNADCWVGKDPGCPAGQSLHGEDTGEHWWSGWPGAVCMKCGSSDPMELCLADDCRCRCHPEPPAPDGEAGWYGYDEAIGF